MLDFESLFVDSSSFSLCIDFVIVFQFRIGLYFGWCFFLKRLILRFKPNPHAPVIYRSLFFYNFGKYLKEQGQLSLFTLYFSCVKIKQLALKDDWKEGRKIFLPIPLSSKWRSLLDCEIAKSYVHHFFLNPRTAGTRMLAKFASWTTTLTYH
jgi:hypothetical protein